jgi:hypothetical protein
MIAKILVTIDSIIDIRLSTLADISASVAKYEYEHGYTKRQYDGFKLVSMEMFKKQMKATKLPEYRPRQYPTRILNIINSLVGNIKDELTEMNMGDEVDVILNTYPYVMSNDEKAVLDVMISDIVMGTSVKIISQAPTIALYGEVNYVFDYYGLSTLNDFSIIDSNFTLNTNIIVPTISLTKTGINHDIMEELRLGVSGRCILDFVNIKDFSW